MIAEARLATMPSLLTRSLYYGFFSDLPFMASKFRISRIISLPPLCDTRNGSRS